jgi:hypothetical protein
LGARAWGPLARAPPARAMPVANTMILRMI